VADSLGFSTPVLASSIVLVAMACISAIVSFTLYRKSRAVARFPKNLTATVFNKTFNIFDPFPESRKPFTGHLELVILLIAYVTFLVFSFVIVKVFETGLFLSLMTLIVCLGLLMIDELLEVNKNANTFMKAIDGQAKFGKGDLDALFFLEDALPRLTFYYVSLSVAFVLLSIAVPFIIDLLLLGLGNFAGSVVALNNGLSFAPHIALLFDTLLFSAGTVFILFVSGRIKDRIFGFASRETVDAAGEQFLRMKTFVGIMHHHPYLNVPEPEQAEKAEKEEPESTEK